jgi:RHS repeat-associated protein
LPRLRHLLSASLIIVIVVPALAATDTSSGAVRLFPVVNGSVGGQTFRTTVELRNSGSTLAECRFEFRSSRTPRAPLVSIEDVAPGEARLLDEFLRELPIATAVRVTCSGNIEVYSRIRESQDGGITYSDGRLFRAFPPDAIGAGESRTLGSSSDLLIAEIDGQPARVTAIFTAEKDGSTAKKTYDLLPFGQRMLDVSAAVQSLGSLRVSVTTEGAGKVVVTKEARDPKLTERARRLPSEHRAAFEHHIAVQEQRSEAAAASAEPQPSITRQLLLSPFKAAPFQDPATGLVLMRDRWYDPSTGTFLTPDPEGYADSANPYAFCGGDPVNCSDPTGRLGDGGDLREHFRQKERAEAERRHRIWCAQNPVECKKLDVRGRGILRMVGGVGQTAAGTGAVLSTGPIPQPVVKGVGGTAIVRGIDNTITGAVETWTGTPRDTVTGRALYLALVKSGVSPAQASKITGWTEVGVDLLSTAGSGGVPALNSALRVRPLGGVINVGGTGEYVNATNLNPLIGETGGQTRNVPNLVRGYAEDIGTRFVPGSARRIISNRLPGFNVNWDGFARGAYNTLQEGGAVDLNIYLTGPAAEQMAIRTAAVRAFQDAGFKNVTITGENVGTMLRATR